MRAIRVVAVFLVLMAAAMLSAKLSAGEQYAFLVGVGNYDPKQLRPLGEAPRADVIEFRDVLVESGFKKENVVLMHDDLKALDQPRFLADADRIRTELQLLTSVLHADDVLIVGFAGHGVQFKGEQEHYFCPTDAVLDGAERRKLISLTELYEQIQGCPARQKLLLVDACRNDPQSDVGRTAGGAKLESVTQPQLAPPPEGVVALFSCAEGQQAFQHPDLKHGIFFYHVLEAWRGKAAGDDRTVTLDGLINYTKSKTTTTARLELGAAQTPRQKGFFDGEWVLRRIVEEKLLINSLGMKLVLIPSGQFLMGSNETKQDLERAGIVFPEGFDVSDEAPRHPVKITRPFYLGQCEVTVGQFRQFVTATGYKTEAETDDKGGYGYNASTTYTEQKKEFNWRNTGWSQSESHPVVNVTWNDAVAFCEWLTQKEGRTYRLPTEAEWEYACRAGTSSRYSTGDAPGSLQGYANVQDAQFEKKFPKFDYAKDPSLEFDDGAPFTSAVGKYKPNGFGLYDMHGNVWEWCADWYDSGCYAKSPASDPQGPASGSARVYRGGCWHYSAWLVRSTKRDWYSPTGRLYNLGFRVASVSSGK